MRLLRERRACRNAALVKKTALERRVGVASMMGDAWTPIVGDGEPLGCFGFAGEGFADEHLEVGFYIQTFLLRQFAGECEVGMGNSQVR